MSALNPIAPDIWEATDTLTPPGTELDVRMVVIRLRDGSLWVHSPIKASDALLAQLRQLGIVRHIVAPNRFHHLFVTKFAEAFPDARLYAAPGLAEKRPDIAFHEVMEDGATYAWSTEILHRCVRGFPAANEVVFFHGATRTLILTDVAFNLQRPLSFIKSLPHRIMGIYGGFAASRSTRFLFIKDKAAFRASMEPVLAWDFDRITVAHGSIVPSGGKDKLRTAYRGIV